MRRQRAARMIVTCTSCQTRFRIPDDKVGPKGARVRCSRCQALFLVRRDEPAPPAAPPEPLRPPEAPPDPAPLAAPRPGSALELELTGDPFALRSGRPAAPPGPFDRAPPEAPPSASTPAPDPFAAAAAADPFAARLSFGPPPGDPFAVATPLPEGGLALEEGERRQRTPMPPSLATIGQEDLPADFRTPGPSGLEVDDQRTEEQALAAEAAPPAPAPAPAAEPPVPPVPRPAPLAPGEATATTAAQAAVSDAVTGGVPVVRRAFSVLLNSLSLALLLVLAGALFLYWTGGGMPALWAAVGRNRETPFEAREVASGLYDTARGKPILFVRGRVVSHASSQGPVRVRVELLDGRRAVAQGEGLLGALPSPEEIWSVASPADGQRLQAALAARAPAPVAPGEVRPFLVILWEPPADLRGLDLRVVAEAGPPR